MLLTELVIGVDVLFPWSGCAGAGVRLGFVVWRSLLGLSDAVSFRGAAKTLETLVSERCCIRNPFRFLHCVQNAA